jgi:hypothetical protein
MARMERDTKFGYGFTLAGIGVPFLIERLVGQFAAICVAVVMTTLGIGFLVAGHRHHEENDSGLGSHRRRKLAIAVLFVTIALAGISALAWRLLRNPEVIEWSQSKKGLLVPPSEAYEPRTVGGHQGGLSKSHQQRPYDLSGTRRKKFIKLLSKPQTEPHDILKIGCISWSDEACVAAGKFLILFSEAGWTIDSNRVFRLDPQIPIDGMGMVTHIDNGVETQKLPPHLGTWQKMDASQITIWWAFKEMGIPIHPSGDQSMPVGTLGIYFGPEPR